MSFNSTLRLPELDVCDCRLELFRLTVEEPFPLLPMMPSYGDMFSFLDPYQHATIPQAVVPLADVYPTNTNVRFFLCFHFPFGERHIENAPHSGTFFQARRRPTILFLSPFGYP